MKKCPRCGAKLPPIAGDQAPLCPQCGVTVWAQGTRPRKSSGALKTGCAIVGTAGFLSAVLVAWLFSFRSPPKVGDVVVLDRGGEFFLLGDSREALLDSQQYLKQDDDRHLLRLAAAGKLLRVSRGTKATVRRVSRDEQSVELDLSEPEHERGWAFVEWLR